MAEKLTKEIAYKEFQKFFQDKPFVLFGTGMSCAIDNNFGMAALEEELKCKMEKESLSNKQKKEWDGVLQSLENFVDFETSMNMVSDEDLINKIVKITGAFVSTLDREHSVKILNGDGIWPASTLFKKLVDKTPGTDRELHVATPNYDLLAEYGFEKNGISYINGFHGGVIRHLDWEQSRRSITYGEKTVTGKRVKMVTRERRHVCLYKVHGSLNWFLMNNDLIENNSWLYTIPPDGTERLIVTPGLSKYKKLHQNRRELLGKYDTAVEKHNFFLFLGFGFNDNQVLNTAFLNKLKGQKCNGLIITKETNNKIDRLLDEADNLWLVCQEKADTIIKNRKYSDPLILENENLWKVDVFTRKILGG
jgi:hypothetical protein